jgi:hypothetical protein
MVLSRFDVHLAGDHLVPKVRDYRRDERETILAFVGDQHPEMLDTRYLRLSKRPPTAACVSWVYGGCPLCLKPRRAGFSGSDTRSVYGRNDLDRSAP